MADRRRDALTPRSHNDVTHGESAGWGDWHRASPLVASSQLLSHADWTTTGPFHYETWQEEAWSFYENLGEFNYGVEWFAEALSRVRLVAAELAPGGDEPIPLDSGPAVDIIEALAGGADAQAQLMRSFATQLSVVGESFLVGREVTDAELFGDVVLDAIPDDEGRVWTVQSTSTLRRSQKLLRFTGNRKRHGWQVQVDDARWIELPRESLVTRVWHRNERLPWRAMSPARAALPVMREIDMYNRYIMATLVSRVALNGLLLIPEEVTLPVNPEYADEVDPFIAEMIDIMRAAIKNPGAPSSAAPVPLRVPAAFADKFVHLKFATPLDDKIFQAREEAIKRLAASLNLPMEVILGMGDVNHWSSWQLEESAIKIHIAPSVEVITRCLTMGVLHPMLRSMGEDIRTKDGTLIVVWYDTSTLTQRPDRSDLALKLNDTGVINDVATRRETGFSEDDAPSKKELETWALRKLAVNPMTYVPALKELTGLELTPMASAATPVETEPGGDSSDSGPEDESLPGTGNEPVRERPMTQDDEPAGPNGAVTASARRAALVRRVQDSDGSARVSAMGTLAAFERATTE